MSTTPPDKRQRAEARGRSAERLASLLLMVKGYRILAHRARTPVGEIDLIARRGKTLAFIEVKARHDRTSALESLTPRQRQRIARAAGAFVRSRPDLADLNWRFDLIAAAGSWRLHHMKDAWRPGLD